MMRRAGWQKAWWGLAFGVLACVLTACAGLWPRQTARPLTASPSVQATGNLPGDLPGNSPGNLPGDLPSETPAQGTPDGGAASSTTQLPPTATLTERITLRVWLPPVFDPQAGQPGSDLLRIRLGEFAAQYPGLDLEVRIKAIDGVGGMIDSLSTTSAAAPLGLPDLVALSYPMLEDAAQKGLLRSHEDLAVAIGSFDWYDYARQLSRLENSIYGLPFAGDVFVLV